MRLSAINAVHKKNTRNTLNMEQMHKLHDLGLAYIAERNGHIDCGYGVEELLQILPACIVVKKKMYILQVYKSAFDVVAVHYKNPKDIEDNTLYAKGCDDFDNEWTPLQSGHLVNVLFDCLLWVNENYPSELEEFKEKLQHYIQTL